MTSRSGVDGRHAEARWELDLAHDICGSTHTILGYASLLDATASSPEDRRMLAAISAAAERITATIEALAAAERPGTDPVEALALEPFVEEASSTWGAGAPDPTRSPGHDEPLPLVLAEPTRLRPLMRLVLSGGASVTDRHVEGGMVSLMIRAPMSSAGRTTRYVLATLADRCGVDLAIHDDDDEAVISLRFARAGGDRTEAAPNGPQSPLTVLHVDDDPAARALVEAVLRGPRFRLISAATAADALQAVARDRPQVLVVDQRLADGTGLDLLAEVQDLQGGHQVAMLVMSGERSDVVLQRAADLGAVVLTKPTPPQVLIDEIERVAHRW